MRHSLVVRLSLLMALIITVSFVAWVMIVHRSTSTAFVDKQTEVIAGSNRGERELAVAEKLEGAFEDGGWPAVRKLSKKDGGIESGAPGYFVLDNDHRVRAASDEALYAADVSEVDGGLLVNVVSSGGASEIELLLTDTELYLLRGSSGEAWGRLQLLPSTPDRAVGDQFATEVWSAAALWLTGVIVSAMLIMTWVLRRSLAPIDWLTAAARELQSGKMPDRIASVKDSEFRALIDAFNAAIEAIARTEKVRKQLIADIAHELRTPVTNIKGQLEAHEAGLISEDAEFVTTLKGENRLLERLVEDFQQLAISDAGQLKVNLQSMPLAEIVRNILEPMAEAANATVVVAVPEMLHVFIDEERFRQVLLNLWENAVRHQPDKLTVTVTAEGPDPYWATLVFQDNGPGIAAEDRPYVFERFFRAEKSRNRALGGAGLGLTIVKGLLEAMGGRIELADRDGGAAFAVTLVRVDPDDAERN